jgi:hypothetical protein
MSVVLRIGAVLVGLSAGGCHAYQRDPGYARARLVEVLHDPFGGANLKYTLALGVAGLVVATVVLFAIGSVRRARARRLSRRGD